MTPTDLDRSRLPAAYRLPGAPLVGSALDLRRDYLGTMLRAHRDGGDVVRIDAGPPGWRLSMHAVFSPEGVERVLADDPDRLTKQTPTYVELRETIGNGLLTSEGETWLRQRRLVAPAFTRRRLTTGYADAIADEAQRLVRRWTASGEPVTQVDAHAEMVRVTAVIIGRLLFGSDVGDAVPRLVRIGGFLNELLLRRGINPHPTPRWLPTPSNRRIDAAVAEMREIVAGIVAERRAAVETSTAHVDRRDADLLGLLLAARDPEGAAGGSAGLTDEEVADQVLVFLLAGHETTATTLACALVELARHRDWQDVVRGEVDSVVGSRPVGAEDVPRLVWTGRVVRETLRLYPAAHTVGRLAPGGDEVLGRRIPPGAVVVVSPWVTHRSPELWAQPSQFDPRRFEAPLPGGHRYAWFPFGAGPRPASVLSCRCWRRLSCSRPCCSASSCARSWSRSRSWPASPCARAWRCQSRSGGGTDPRRRHSTAPRGATSRAATPRPYNTTSRFPCRHCRTPPSDARAATALATASSTSAAVLSSYVTSSRSPAINRTRSTTSAMAGT